MLVVKAKDDCDRAERILANDWGNQTESWKNVEEAESFLKIVQNQYDSALKEVKKLSGKK